MTTIIEARQQLSSGPYLPEAVREEAPIVLIVAIDHEDAALVTLCEEVAHHQLHNPSFKPLFLVGGAGTRCLSTHRFQFETVLTRDAWAALGLPGTYDRFLERRVQATRRLYQPATVVIARAGTTLPVWALV